MFGRQEFIFFILMIMVLFLYQSKGFAMEITDKFSIGGILYGAYQYQDVSDDAGTESKGKGGNECSRSHFF